MKLKRNYGSIARRSAISGTKKPFFFDQPKRSVAPPARRTEETLDDLRKEMFLLENRRVTLPLPEETQAFGLWPEKLKPIRRSELEKAYKENAVFKRLVDEIRKNKKHYINQLSEK